MKKATAPFASYWRGTVGQTFLSVQSHMRTWVGRPEYRDAEGKIGTGTIYMLLAGQCRASDEAGSRGA
jgi:hypothetical protein